MGIYNSFDLDPLRKVAPYYQRLIKRWLETPLLAADVPPAALRLWSLVSTMSGRWLYPHSRPRAIFSFCDTKLPAIELVIIELFDSIYGSWLIRERYESKPSRATGNPVGWQKHLSNVPHLRKQGCEFILGCIVTEVFDKDFWADNVLLAISYLYTEMYLVLTN